MKNDSFLKNISFYSHHSSWGSYATFTLGLLNHGAGFTLGNVQPAANNFYIGYKQDNEQPKLFPFYSDNNYGLSIKEYQSESIQNAIIWRQQNTICFTENKIKRDLKWATETWQADALTLRIMTPFNKIPSFTDLTSDELQFILAPLITVELELDNTNNKSEMTALFAMQGLRRPLSDVCNTLLGVASGTAYGFAVKKADGIHEIIDWDVVQRAFTSTPHLFRLSFEGGLCFSIPPGQKICFNLVMATYQDGVITSHKKTKMYYTEFFNDLESVLEYGVNNFLRYKNQAALLDTELDQSALNGYKKFMLSQFTRSYLANTELLIDSKNNPIFVVNEGEYQMMNTFDLIIDQSFWELYFTPWTLKNELDFYTSHYSYTDYVKLPNQQIIKAGIGFCHDQGVANSFTPDGRSSYEMNGKSGCFSYMTYEEILNWLLTAGIYGILAPDHAWLNQNSAIFDDILSSLQGRDGNHDGIMDRDTNRSAQGSEITTYDSLDISLGQARNNLYLAVKAWAGYIYLGKIFKLLNKQALSEQADKMAMVIAETLCSKYKLDQGYIPAVFENNNTSRIIPAVEGLIYPYIIGDHNAVAPDGRFGSLIRLLTRHIEHVLKPGICIDKFSGGWKLSSTSQNTWMSKIIINQYVINKILKFKTDDWEKWDEIHALWQQTGTSAFAATDQIDSSSGQALGSRLYPRLVSGILWLKY